MQNHESVSRMETKAAGRDAKRLRKPRQPYLTRTATALSEGGAKNASAVIRDVTDKK